MVKGIREVESALGSPRKLVAASETKNQGIARKSLVAAVPILKGEQFTLDNLTSKRPGNGISPMHYWQVLGRCASRDYERDELILDYGN